MAKTKKKNNKKSEKKNKNDDTILKLKEQSDKIYSQKTKVIKLKSMGGGASGATGYLIKDKKNNPIGFVKMVKDKFNKGMNEFNNHKLLREIWKKRNVKPSNSLFPIHKIDYIDTKTIYLMMDYILAGENKSSFFFDIKGNPGNKKIKDDFLFISLGINLKFNNLKKIYQMIKKDTKLLEDNDIMDYSMTIAAPSSALNIESQHINIGNEEKIKKIISSMINNKKTSPKTFKSISMEPWKHGDLDLCIDLNYPTPFLEGKMKEELRKKYKSKKFSIKELQKYYQTIPKLIPVFDMDFKHDKSKSKFHVIDPSQKYLLIKKIQSLKSKNKKCSKCQRDSLLLKNCSVCGDSSCDPDSYRLRFLNFFENITCKNSKLINCPQLCK